MNMSYLPSLCRTVRLVPSMSRRAQSWLNLSRLPHGNENLTGQGRRKSPAQRVPVVGGLPGRPRLGSVSES